MKKKFLGPFMGLILLASGALAQKLELTVNVPDLPNDTIVLFYNLVDQKVDTSYVKNNSISITKPMKDGGSMFILQVGMQPEKTGLGTVLMLEPTKVNISGKGKGFKDIVYSGSPFADELERNKNFLIDLNKSIQELESTNLDIGEAMKVGDQEVLDKLNAEARRYREQLIKSGRDWLDQNLSSPLAAYMLNPFMSTLFNKNEKDAYLKKFKGDALNNQVAKRLLASADGKHPLMNKMAPNFSFSDAQGKMVSLSDFKGKYVLLDFWASWCSPCRDIIPELKSVYEKYKGKNFTILNVSLDKDKSKWLTALDEEKMPWTNLLDDNSTSSGLYNIQFVPMSFLLDPDGKIIIVSPNMDKESDRSLVKQLDALLK